MKFLSQDTVTDAFGPKAYDPTKTVNWAPTRYVPWSSWAVGDEHLAQRPGQQLDRGRELRHGRLRP